LSDRFFSTNLFTTQKQQNSMSFSNPSQAPYVDPRTNLRYANAHVFQTVRSLSSDQVHQYLSIRNAAVVLK